LHAAAPPRGGETVFGERGGGVAFVVEQGAKLQVFHGDRPGKAYDAVGQVAVSADGRRCAYGALEGGRWRMVVDGVEGDPFSAVRSPAFSPDGAHVAYQAMAGERWYLVVDGRRGPGTPTRYLSHAFGADGSRIVAIEDVDDQERGRLVVTDVTSGDRTVVAEKVFEMALDPERTRVAALAARDGGLRVLSLDLAHPAGVAAGPVFAAVQGIGFGPGGAPLGYVAHRDGPEGRRGFAVLGDRQAPLPPGHVVAPPAFARGGSAMGVLIASDETVSLWQPFADAAATGPGYDEADGLAYGPDGRSHAYAARRGGAWRVVVNGHEGPPLDRVVTPIFTPDGARVIYRARKDGRRFVVVADAEARTVREHPGYEQVFPVQLGDGGRTVAYGVKDGRQLLWKVEPL
jgi:hypothetical protein